MITQQENGHSDIYAKDCRTRKHSLNTKFGDLRYFVISFYILNIDLIRFQQRRAQYTLMKYGKVVKERA